jgi:flagellar protein FlbD
VIQLTRLNSKPLFVNADLIKFVEQSPDTLVTLISGEKLVVRETAEQIRDLFIAFRRSILTSLASSSEVSPSPSSFPEPAPRGEQEPEK